MIWPVAFLRVSSAFEISSESCCLAASTEWVMLFLKSLMAPVGSFTRFPALFATLLPI